MRVDMQSTLTDITNNTPLSYHFCFSRVAL